MRTSIFILAAAVAFTACSTDRPTAPSASGQSQLDASGQSPSYDVSSGASVKPPRFTVTTVRSAGAYFGAVFNNYGYPTMGTLTATCPVGTTVIGGGFTLAGNNPEVLVVLSNEANASNGWSVKVLFTGTQSTMQATASATATCLQ